ncbi:hypothetical protein [Cellulomonas fimi]|uniref:Transmembrane protein n=1 Tax=Cellulomonas fimi (strain ATCC 484 / DSM 20113 / JCM 1341 / CCUG 24087 / LMG 16345 / NBRC 15513 / NCIMB 8980 / NCTC 7547 / NRS-133) TaxID=590998 RepID=F4H227_CELFA|nr:hypothetical protein [Cellulomonas fimi]AEE45197.1 hypothetical protein Celf_1060 [Cellulomonas fimi ATCC 484]NNH07137.1 hypothetical protein [Cellulomonas fimi]VEH28537.1 Uncharacterised protein [Cellulomonas fimi]
MSTLTLRDLLVREAFLTRFSWAVQDYPRSERLVRDLRRELTAAADDVGVRRAVADLGHPRVLAEGYLATLDHRVPRWATGATWAALAVGAVAYLVVAYAVGTLDTLADLGGGTLTRTTLGATTVYTSTDGELSVGTEASWQWLVLYGAVFAVVFTLGARLWRLLPTRERDLTRAPA